MNLQSNKNNPANSGWHYSPLKSWRSLGPYLAKAGRREDYRKRDEWGNPAYPQTGYRDRIGSLLPVSYSGIILLICVVIFFLSQIAHDFVQNYLAITPYYLPERPWTLLTYMFVHFDFDHLFFNMLFLFFFGMELERRVGEKKFLQIYIISGIVAALAQVAVSSSSMVPMVGASGALFGALGCLAIIAPEIRVLLFFIIPVSIRWAVVLFALMDFVFMGAADNIAHMAHIAGLLVGLAYGQTMKNRVQYRYR